MCDVLYCMLKGRNSTIFAWMNDLWPLSSSFNGKNILRHWKSKAKDHTSYHRLFITQDATFLGDNVGAGRTKPTVQKPMNGPTKVFSQWSRKADNNAQFKANSWQRKINWQVDSSDLYNSLVILWQLLGMENLWAELFEWRKSISVQWLNYDLRSLGLVASVGKIIYSNSQNGFSIFHWWVK